MNRRWQLLSLISGPLAAILLYVMLRTNRVDLSPAGCATLAILLWMALWWLTEATHISTTALLPLVVFPLCGVRAMGDTAASYAQPLIFLFLGGFVVALAMQRCGLDRRIALLTLSRVGTRPANMVAGFMLATAGLSAFVSNTATSAMMLPIALSVIALVRRNGDPSGQSKHLAVCLLLGIAYAASLGGLMTIIGTPPNVFFVGFVKDKIAEPYRTEVSFVRWLCVGLPVGLTMIPICWWLLTQWLYPVSKEPIEGGSELIQTELRKLGRPSQAELLVLVVFVTTALAWITRPWLSGLKISSGGVAWAPLEGLSDPGIAMTAAVALFLLPSGRGAERLMDWEAAEKLPWHILLLFGGGVSLAGAVTDNGVAEFLGKQAQQFAGAPHVLLVVVVAAAVVFLTELTSNLATVTALLPILAALGPGLQIDPYLLIIPATVAASCAFMMPIATPPNAIIFGSGEIQLPQMMKAGWWLNLIAIVVVSLTSLMFWKLISP